MEIQVKPQEFGIEPKKANELIGNLPQIKKEREVLEKQFNEVVKMDIENPETSKIASELRKLVKKNRTQGIAVWHKTTKDFFLKGGQFVDAIKRMEVAVNERMENDLEQIEKYAEIKEQKILDELEAKRKQTAEPYSEFLPFGIDIRNITDEDFEKLINGAKLQLEAKLEAEKRDEQERLENERLDKLEQNRRFELAPYTQFITESPQLREMSDSDYEKLLKSLKVAKKEYEAEQEKIRVENERLKKEAEAKEKALELERKKAKEEADKREAERQAELKAEREKQAKLEAELKAKREAEYKAEQERKDAELKAKKEAEKLAKAPIKKKMQVWIDSFIIPNIDVENESTKEIKAKFESFKNWAKKECEKY